MGRRLANKYRAWESFCRDQAALAGSGLQRRGLEASAEYCRAAADEIERASWTQFWTQTSQDSISPDVLDGMKGRAIGLERLTQLHRPILTAIVPFVMRGGELHRKVAR
jgi:hypothetical protein